jgi:hypothetical protein
MKYLCVLLMSSGAIFAQPAGADAFKNEPADFRGIEWGAAYVDHADDLNLVRTDDDVLVYIRDSEKGQSTRNNYKKIAYRFYKDRFSAGIIQTFGQDAKKQLRRSLVSTYGEAVRISRRQELDAWDGEFVQIVLSCSATSYCAAEFMSKEMIALEERETGTPVQVLQKERE